MINQHLNESVNHGEVGPDLPKCDLYTTCGQRYYREAHLEGVETLLTCNRISAFTWHSFPLLGLLGAPFAGVFGLLCLGLARGPALPLQPTGQPTQLSGPSGLQMSPPSMSETDLIKVHSAFCQGGWQPGREEGAVQARCWECRGAPYGKDIY